MNNCGCYHFFIPHKDMVQRVIPSPLAIDAFVPRWLPEDFPKKRLNIHINSGWHQVNHIVAEEIPPHSIPYHFMPYDQLEMLSRSGNAYESMFTPEGIGKFSERIEPMLLFPMGIPSVGSMRQRGHHAVKLVGRSHFDDPHLFDISFEFK